MDVRRFGVFVVGGCLLWTLVPPPGSSDEAPSVHPPKAGCMHGWDAPGRLNLYNGPVGAPTACGTTSPAGTG